MHLPTKAQEIADNADWDDEVVAIHLMGLLGDLGVPDEKIDEYFAAVAAEEAENIAELEGD